MSEANDKVDTMNKETKANAYYVLTGELVRIVAYDEDEMWEKLSNGDYEEQEALSEIQNVEEVTMEVCPNHEGGFDCTPFCDICEGNQEYEKKNND